MTNCSNTGPGYVATEIIRHAGRARPRRPTRGRCGDDRPPYPLGTPGGSADDPERIAIREALAFDKALYDICTELGATVAELAARAGMTDDERIEEGGNEPAAPSSAGSLQRSTPPSTSPRARPRLRLIPGTRRLSKPKPRSRTAYVLLWFLPATQNRRAGSRALRAELATRFGWQGQTR